MVINLTELVKAISLIVSILKLIINILTIPILLIGIYATIVRLIESINQLQQQPNVQTTWAKIIQTIKNFRDIETYKK